jgi:cell division protein FtsW
MEGTWMDQAGKTGKTGVSGRAGMGSGVPAAQRRVDGGPDAGAVPAPAPAGAATAVRAKGPQSDFLLAITVIGLVLFGIVMVFSASYYSTINSDMENPYYYLIQTSKWAVVGIALMAVLSYVPYRLYFKAAPVLAAIGLALLIAIYIPGIGTEGNNAMRWIEVGPVTVMPGEIAKVTSILFVAWFFTKYRHLANTFKRAYLPMLALTIAYFALIYNQPSLSTSIIVCGIVAIMTCMAGNPKRYFALTVAGGAAAVYALIQANPSSEHYERFTGFLDPFSDPLGAFYQTVQGLLALGAGGLAGVGPGRSIQKALYLPYAQNDFIFAIIGEEFGFLGCLAVLCAFLFLIWRCALIAINAPDRFGMLIASGVVVWMSLQAIMNVAVVTSLMPPTGVTLPFISYGGNAVLISMVAMGVMLNISRETSRANAEEARREEKEAAAAEEARERPIGYDRGKVILFGEGGGRR